MKILTSEIKKGMKLKEDVLDGSNMLVEKGVILNDVIIAKLRNFNIAHVNIEKEKLGKFIEMDKILEKENILKTEFKKDYEKAIEKAEGILHDAAKGQLNKIEIEELVEETLDNLNIESNILVSLLKSENNGDYIFQHSINTVVIAMLIGKSLDYSSEKIKVLGKGALLHDIGMLKVKSEIIYKKGRLTDSELAEMKTHVLISLKELKNIDSEVMEMIKYHHEKIDGTGYPDHLKGNEIPEMARIISIADIYTALIEERAYRKKYDYYDAMKIVLQSSKNIIDSSIMKKFLKVMPIYPINSRIILNDKRTGIVVKANENPFRPIIDLEDESGMVRADLLDEDYENNYIIGVKK